MTEKKEQGRGKRWLFRSEETAQAKREADAMAAALNIHPIVARLLHSRGYTTAEEARVFLSMENEMLENPFALADIVPAVTRILNAVAAEERITVYGDYDVDGVTSVCTLYLYLTSIGGKVDYYIPNRATDGYGVSTAALESFASRGTRLVITVDTGITAGEEVAFAAAHGMDVVITDHHECRSELPKAVAVVNPHRPDCAYPFKDLAGVGVVFKLISAIEESRSGRTRAQVAKRLFDAYADLVAIGTIADVMPIRGENRIIVSRGLSMMEHSERVGLLALIDAAGTSKQDPKGERRKRKTKISSGYIGYTIAPRINAAGRIKSASRAVELFLSKNYGSAYAIAEELCRANKERQNEENKIIARAQRLLDEDPTLKQEPVLVLSADDWHHGVIGIVASRMTEKYSRPSILVSFEGGSGEDGEDVGKGSGRSIKGMNLVDALCYCRDVLVKFGGHELASGLSVTRENLPLFRQKINEYAAAHLSPEDMVPSLDCDLTVDFANVNMELAEALGVLEPYGVGNPVPTFVMQDVSIAEIAAISEGKHTRIVFTDGSRAMTGMYFSTQTSSLGLYPGDRADVMFTVDINEWQGRRSVQLIIKDVRPSALQSRAKASERARFEQIWAGAPIAPDEDVVPNREDFGAVYRLIVASIRSGTDTLSHPEMCSRLSHGPQARPIGYIKLKIIIKVFIEMNILGIEETCAEVYTFRLHYSTGKTDLERSSLLRRLRSQVRP